MNEVNKLSGIILNACINIHKTLGPGLLESAYEECLCAELDEAGIKYERQKPISLVYKGHMIGEGFRADLVVDGTIIIELKSVKAIEPVHFSQLLTYLKIMDLPLGLLINFNEERLVTGFHRLINKEFKESKQEPTNIGE